jgi:hypothetical protein
MVFQGWIKDITMPIITVTRSINAPIDLIFKSISDISNLPKTNRDIVNIEFISDIKSGVGTRFIETRLMNGKESKTELEITELVENEHIRVVADSHGTVWDSVFTVKSSGDQVVLKLAMDARAHKLLPRLLNPLMKGLYKNGLEKHMDAVKTFCEE